MFTATEGVMLPTTVTGSWPRPAWFTTDLWGKPVSHGLTDMNYREQFIDATATVISEQERAGLDIIVNGDYHLDSSIGGLAWILWNAERLGGVDTVGSLQSTSDWAWPSGTLLHEVMGGWRFPPVVDKLSVRIPFEFDKLWRIAQARTDKPIKFGTVSAQVLGAFVENRSDYYDDDKRQLIWDMAELANAELRQLAAAGCKVIQIEDPMVHLVSAAHPPREYIDFLIDALNREMEGLDECEVWVHTCWGNPSAQMCTADDSYEGSIEDYLYRVNCDVLTLEMKDRHFREIELLKNYKDSPTKVAVGIVSHRTLQADTSEKVAADIRLCLKHVDPEKLVLSTDCGFGRQGMSRMIAYYKAAGIVAGTNIVRAELGLPPTHPRNDDPRTQTDPMVPIGEDGAGGLSQGGEGTTASLTTQS